MNNILKYFFITIGIVIVIYIGFRLLGNSIFTHTWEKKYTMQDAISNFNTREDEITELIDYFNSRLPADRVVSFGFGKNDNLFNIGISLPEGRVDENHPNFGGNNLKLNSDKTDSLLSILNWSNSTIDTIKRKLKSTNCINIISGNPIRIEYRYSNFGLYSYLIFDKWLSDSEINMYDKKFSDTVIRKHAVIVYTSSP